MSRLLVLSLAVAFFLSAATGISASGIRELNSTHGSGLVSAGGGTKELASQTSPLLIRFRSATFDPLRGEPQLPTGLGIASYPAGESGYFIVQFSGPVMAEWKERIIELGGTLSWYIPDYAFLVRMDSSVKTKVQSLPFVRWVGIYQPAYKIHPDLLDRAAEPVTIDILTSGDGLDQVVSMVGDLGGEVLSVAGEMIRAQVNAAKISELAAMNDVVWVEPWAPRMAFNDTARWVIQSGTSGFTPIHDNGIRGENQIVTIADTGLRVDAANRPSHEMFVDPGKAAGPTNRKVQAYYIPLGANGAIGDEAGHGTHVAGTVAGDAGTWGAYDNAPGSSGKHDGQAFDARIVMQDIDYSSDAYVYPPDDYNNLFQPAYDIGSLIHTNSWGEAVSGYNVWTQMIDNFMWVNKSFQILFAAGNSGQSAKTLDAEAEAKNAISVGATLNGASADQIASWSSRGLASDNRIKPTVVAPGVGIWSADYSGDNLYVQYSGTSMATPAVAGAVALIRQYYEEGWYPTGEKNIVNAFEPSSALVRATLINGAIEISGSGAYQNSTKYPNGDQGWGRVNLSNSLYFKGDAKRMWVVDNTRGVATGQTATYQIQVSDNTQPLEFTLAWTDYPGSPAASVQLVNDLNLGVTAPDNNVYRGNVFTSYKPGYSTTGGTPDNRNVEETVLLLPDNKFPTGTYTVEVIGYNVPNGEAGENAQPFALVVTGGILPTQPHVTPTLAWVQTNWEGGPMKSSLQVGRFNRTYFNFYDNENVDRSLAGKIKLASFGVPVSGIATHVVISEFATRGLSSTTDDFVELYNPTSSAVNISGWTLDYLTGSWKNGDLATFPSGASIPAYGFYLWGGSGYSGPTPDWSTSGTIEDGSSGAPRGVRIRDSTGTVIDTVVYDGSASGGASSTFAEGGKCAPGSGTSANNKSVERKSGPDNLPHYENLGNGRDTDYNFNDWYRRTTRQPQNSDNAIELPPGVAFRSAGWFESSVFDAGKTVDWRKVTWIESRPTGTNVIVKVRTGGGDNPYDGGWSDWYQYPNGSENTLMPNNRYAQYRVELSTTDNAQTPELSEIVLAYEFDTVPPPAPALVWPANGENINDNTPNLDWNLVSDNSLPVLYGVWVDNDFSFSSIDRDSRWISADQWEVIPALADGVWYWRVQAKDNAGNISDNSVARSFRVDTLKPAAPGLVSPADGENTNDNTPTFEWTSVTDPSGVTYQIQIGDNVGSPVYWAIDITEITHTLLDENALALGMYYWRVRAVDGVGNIGDWSESRTFTVTTSVSFTLNLQAGWNMISFPVMLDNKDPHSIFTGDYTMFRWDAENKRYVLCTDENIENGVGYWVYVSAAENVVVSGTPVDSLTLSLSAGWNLIGVPLGGENIANPDDTPDNSVLPYAFTWDPGNRMYTPPMTDLVAGAGYWVYARNSCVLRLPGGG